MAAPFLLERDAWRLFEVDPGAPGELQGYLDRILARCRDWFEATSASIFLRDSSHEDFCFVAGDGSPKTRIKAGQGIAGVVAQSQQAVLVNDPEDHPLLRGKVKARREKLASSIVVPLTQGAECVGVLNLSRKAGSREFANEDLQRVRSVARQVSLAVANARLFVQSERAKDRLRAVLKSLAVGVLVIDGEKKIIDWNDRAAEQLGISGAMELGDLRRPDLVSAIENSLVLGRDNRVRTTDARSWLVRATSLRGGGATVTIEDTTEQEQAIAEMDRLKRLAEIGQMTAAIAHEIRNPLTGIRSAAQLVSEDPSTGKEMAEVIEEEVQKLNWLCEQFLEFARPMVMRVAPMKLARSMEKLAASVGKQFEEARVTLELEIGHDQPTITADALRLEQVARNLLLNALQACRPGGTVRMKVGDRWLSVEDDGCGMSPEQQERLFTPFFTTKPSGTGLGLSNLRKIVDAHGGQVTVTSGLQRGSRFMVVLPVEVLA